MTRVMSKTAVGNPWPTDLVMPVRPPHLAHQALPTCSTPDATYDMAEPKERL